MLISCSRVVVYKSEFECAKKENLDGGCEKTQKYVGGGNG